MQNAEALLQFYIALHSNKHIWIYCHLHLAYFCITSFGTCSSLCITLYPIVVCTVAFASCPFMIPFIDLNVLDCSTDFAVIKFLVPFYLHILYLTFVSSHFEFLFQIFCTT